MDDIMGLRKNFAYISITGISRLLRLLQPAFHVAEIRTGKAGLKEML